MTKLTTKERFTRMFEHRDADRIPIIDLPWGATIERWHSEGMPEGIHFADFFKIDRVMRIGADNSPRYEAKVIEENDKYVLSTTPWGTTLKNWKHAASTPEFIDFTITSPDKWAEAKKRMVPSRDRINWKYLEENYKKWRENGYWIQADLFFGFDVTHSWIVGTERLLMALIENPEWCTDMFSHELEVGLALLEMIWDAGYEFDSIQWPDDMGYKGTQFFSIDMYRELLKPYHKKAVEWAHSKGIKAHLHSCGDVNPIIPELIEIGVDALNPLEVKAGMNPMELKKKFGDKLVLHGGINAVLWDKPEEIKEEMARVIPTLKENGGYIFSSDHSVPSSVSLEDFKHIIEYAKKLGSYE